MPYSIKQAGGRYQVVVTATGQVIGTHDTLTSAQKQLAAVEAQENERNVQQYKEIMIRKHHAERTP